MQEIERSFQWATVIAFIILLIGSFTWYAPDEQAEVNVDIPTAQEIADLIVFPSNNITGITDNDKLDEIHRELFKEDSAENIAEELVMDEMDTRDFKRDLIDFLMDEVPLLEDMDYKDVESYDIRDVDVDLDGEEAIVEVEFKVYVSNYGDDDEEEVARLFVIFEVEDLDEDKDYEDAEVNDYSEFELLRFYD